MKKGTHKHLALKQSSSGFTLVELIVAVAIIGILSATALAVLRDYKERAGAAAVASEMKSFMSAFVAYYSDNEEYPPDSHLSLPPGMNQFIPDEVWSRATPLGGTYNWEGPDNYPYAGISIFNHTAPERVIRILDKMLDDGDPDTGRFRVMSNGRPTLLIEE